MLLSEYTAPYLECKAKIAKAMDNLDLIPSFKVLLVDTYLHEGYPKWDELVEEWPNVTKMIQDLTAEMVELYGTSETVGDAWESLLADYKNDVKGLE